MYKFQPWIILAHILLAVISRLSWDETSLKLKNNLSFFVQHFLFGVGSCQRLTHVTLSANVSAFKKKIKVLLTAT